MAEYNEAAVARLQEKLGEAVREVRTFRGERVVVLEREAIVEACRLLREDPDLQFNFLACLTAVDDWPTEPRFTVVYRLYSVPNNNWVGLEVRVDGEDPEVPSITSVFPSASWHEREVYDMFGIRFSDHPDLRRILMPQDWEGHPLRKDYPLGYEEVQFTFNFDDINRRKRYAQE